MMSPCLLPCDDARNRRRRGGLVLSLAALIFLAVFTSTPRSLDAQPIGGGTAPLNDKCDNAIAVSEGIVCFCTDFSTTGDIPDTIAVVIVSDYDIKSDIWYCYTPSCSGTAEITVTGLSGLKFAVYSGCECSSAELIEAKPDCPSTATTVKMKMKVGMGEPLLIRIGHCDGKTYDGMLDIQCHPGVSPNDVPDCKKFTLAERPRTFDFMTATPSGAGAFPALSADLWYSYTATCDEFTTFSLCGSSPGTLIAVYLDDGTPPGVGNLLGSDFMSCMGAGEVSLMLMPGLDYTIQAGQPQGLIADGELTITRVPTSASAPPNDLCTAPETLFNDVPTLFDTNCASTDGLPDPLCDFFGEDDIGNDVWYCYTATCNDLVTVRIADMPFDTKLAVYDNCGCPAAGSQPIACNDDALLTLASEVRFQGMMGSQYTIRIGGSGGITGVGEVIVTCAPPTPPPANDLVAAATPAVVGLNSFTTRGAESDGPSSCDCDPKEDVWFIFTSTVDGTVRISTCGLTDYDSYIAVYPVDPVAPGQPPIADSHLACNDDNAACALESEVRAPITAGESVLIRIGGFGGLEGSGQFDLFVQSVEFIRGDCNADGLFNIADAVRCLTALFGGGTTPPCIDACDANDDGAFDIADPVRILQNLFAGLPVPVPPPHPLCGPDPTLDATSCVQFGACP